VNAHVPGAATEILPADDGCLPADEIVRSVRCEKRAGKENAYRSKEVWPRTECILFFQVIPCLKMLYELNPNKQEPTLAVVVPST
jgi:hypothetical protein